MADRNNETTDRKSINKDPYPLRPPITPTWDLPLAWKLPREGIKEREDLQLIGALCRPQPDLEVTRLTSLVEEKPRPTGLIKEKGSSPLTEQ